jgi:CrcB protein
VAAGGALGAVLRWAVSLYVHGFWPWGTLLANATGCFAIGVVARAYGPPRDRPRLRAFLAVGVCGGYTTFSTYAAEVVGFATGGRLLAALIYASSSLAICLVAAFAGFHLAGPPPPDAVRSAESPEH